MMTAKRITVCLACVLVAVCLVPAPVAAQEGVEEEIAAAKKRVRELVTKAEELQKQGRTEEARKLVNQAEELQSRLEKFLARRREARGERREREGERHERRLTDRQHLEQTLEQLHVGMQALRTLGRKEELAALERLAARLKERLEQGGDRRERDSERDVARRRLRIMRLAVEALAEAGKRDAAEAMERAMHADELRLEGRRGEEAARVIEGAPNRGQRIELLNLAGEILADRGKREAAHAVFQLGRELRERGEHREGRERGEHREGRERGEHREGRERGERSERDIVEHRIEVMKMARKGLLEGDREDAADVLQRAIRAYEVALEGRRDEKAMAIRERAPGAGNRAEALSLAARMYREFKMPDRAEMCAKLARQYAERDRPREGAAGRERDRRREGDREGIRDRDPRQRIEQIEEQMRELMNALEKLNADLQRLKRDRR